MFKRFGIIILFVFFVFQSEAKILDRIVAIVNGEVITLYDLKKEVKKANLAGRKNIDLNDKSLLKQFLSDMINRILLKEEADKLGIKVSKYEVENQLKQIIKSSELTEEEFKKEIQSQDITLEEFKKNLEDNIKINKLISFMVRRKVVVTDEDIEKYLEQHSSQFGKKERIHILLFESKEKDALENIKVDKDNKFSSVKNVKVMDMGYVAIKGLQKKWREAIKGVEVGSFSPIFEINGEYVRLFVAGKDIIDPALDTEMKNKIRERIFREKLKARYVEYINKLRSKAVIEIRI